MRRTCGVYYHDLRVTAADGTIAWFHAFCPERFAVISPAPRRKILAEIAGYAGAETQALAIPAETPGGRKPQRQSER